MSAPEFVDGVAAQHHRLDREDWEDVYVVGDVHGCRSELDALLSELDPGREDLLLFVGDLVRRGPDGPGVVDVVRSTPNALAVRGNNEEKLLRGTRPAPDLSRADLAWLGSLPVAVSWPGHLVVHAGVDPRRSLDEHTVDDLQNVASLAPDGDGPPYWWQHYDGPRRVYFGHEVLAEPLVGDHAVGLDTGCVYGGALSAVDVRTARTVSVPAERTYRERSPEKFLSVPAVTPA